jgi:hypothetical protein
VPLLVPVLRGRPGGEHDADRDDPERDPGPDAEVLPRRDRDQRRDRALGGGDRRDEADLADPHRRVDEQQADDVARPGNREPDERAAVEGLGRALCEGHRPDDEQPGEHHPGERRGRADLPARPRAGERRDRPGDRCAESPEDRDHVPSLRTPL